jgi:hypothetical protein
LSVPDGNRIGEILRTRCGLSDADVARALRAHREEGIRIGEAFVRLGLVSPRAVESALRVQSERRRWA